MTNGQATKDKGIVELRAIVRYSPNATKFDFFDEIIDGCVVGAKLKQTDIIFTYIHNDIIRTITKSYISFFDKNTEIVCRWDIPNERISLSLEVI